MTSEIGDELKWAKEALAAKRNDAYRYRDTHKIRFPTRYQHFLDTEPHALEDHVERLERDLESNWFIGSDGE